MDNFTYIIPALLLIFLIGYDYIFRFKNAFLGHYLPASKNPKIYLTFDDGPHYKNSPWGDNLESIQKLQIESYNNDQYITDNIINLLEMNNLNAIFFVHGESYSTYRTDYKRSVLGNHGFSHKNSTEISNSELIEEFNKADQLITDCEAFRPPGGSWNHNLTNLLWDSNINYSLPIYWDFDTKDYDKDIFTNDVNSHMKQDIEKIISLVLNKKRNVVLLQHDVWIYSYIFTEALIKECKLKSISIGDVNDLIEHSKKLTKKSKGTGISYYLYLRLNQFITRFYSIL